MVEFLLLALASFGAMTRDAFASCPDCRRGWRARLQPVPYVVGRDQYRCQALHGRAQSRESRIVANLNACLARPELTQADSRATE
jgi:hypothetical protein